MEGVLHRLMPIPANITTNDTPTVYISFGSVLTGYILNQNPELEAPLLAIYSQICAIILNHAAHYNILIAAPGIDASVRNLPIIRQSTRVTVRGYSDQKAILSSPSTRLFVTHGGGNSISETISCQCPVFVMPFFGDQRVTAERVASRGIGAVGYMNTSISTADLHIENADVRNELFSALDPTQLQRYRNALKKMCSDDNEAKNMATLPTANTIKWLHGDLLFGTNPDRLKHVNNSSSFRISEYRPFSSLFDLKKTPRRLPRILDMYNDVLRNKLWYNTELKMKEELARQGGQAVPYFQILEKMKKFMTTIETNAPTDPAQSAVYFGYICTKQMEFYMKQLTLNETSQPAIHFLLDSYNSTVNLVCKAELEWLQDRWDDEDIQTRVFFYRTGANGDMMKVSPPFHRVWRQHPRRLDKVRSTLAALHSEPMIIRNYITRIQQLLDPVMGGDAVPLTITGRIKSVRSIEANYAGRDDLSQYVQDLIGIRVITTWTEDTHKIAKFLHSSFGSVHHLESSERDKVMYLHTTDSVLGASIEIQVWPSLVYAGFAYDHDRIYKPAKTITEQEMTEAKERRQGQHAAQDAIDKLRFLPTIQF